MLLATWIIAGLAVAGVIAEGGRAWMRWSRRHRRLWDALLGTPESRGVPAQPGVLERVREMSDRIDTIDERTKQLEPNGGKSLADRVQRIETAIGDAAKKVLVDEAKRAVT